MTDEQESTGSPSATSAAAGRVGWVRKAIPWASMALIAVVAWWAQSSVERAKTAELANALETTLAANTESLTLWFNDRKGAAAVLALDPRVVPAVVELLTRRGPAGEDVPRAELLDSPAGKRLRAVLGELAGQTGHSGYVVIDRTGRAVAASEDGAVGGRQLADRTDAVRHALAGTGAVSRPFPSEVPIPDADGTVRPNVPTMLVATPLRTAAGEVVAALALRVRPEAGFTRILQVARFGETGETYAVDARGLMLSQSRFDQQLRDQGILAGAADARSMLGLDVRDPGGDMTEGYRPPLARQEQPLTRMAAAVAAGRDGTDVAGYRDYRGVPVVGAWKWLPDYGFGVTTEVDVAEAYRPLGLLRRTIWVLLGLLLVSNVLNLLAMRGLTDLRGRAARAERKVRQAELKSRQLGQYTLEEKLGEGGMGAVYRASHAMLRRPTAIKLMTAQQPGMRDLLRFEREVQLTSRLNHPNTITIFDYGRTPEGIFYYAMEFLLGANLDRLVRQAGPLPDGRVVYILEQVVAALHEAHAIGLTHRDIKPANIMLCDRGGMFDFVKVLDFGLVREVNSADPAITAANTITGTPQYLAPEVIRDPGQADTSSDLYAVGAVGYFLLTGRPVFTGVSAMDVMTQHLTATPDRPSKVLARPVDAVLEHLVVRCLAKRSADRPANAAAVLADLRRCPSRAAWTNDDAHAWWAAHAVRPAAATQTRSDAQTSTMTIAVALDSRG